MNDTLGKILVCVGGFLAMFLPLYLFADPLISPLYNEVPAVTGPVRTDAGEMRRAQSSDRKSVV